MTKNRRSSQSGQGLIELALLLMLVAFVAIVGLHLIGSAVSSDINKVSGGFGPPTSIPANPTPTDPADCQQGHGKPADNGKCNGH